MRINSKYPFYNIYLHGIIRDKDGKIIHYSFRIFKKNKTHILGKFDRNEMNQLYGLYSYYGNNLQQRVVSRYFPDYSLVDIKRILRAFNITKASSPFAPHMYEEHTEDELKEILARLKENNFLKRVEKDQLNDLQKLNDKIAKENLELKQKLTDLSDIHIDINGLTWRSPARGTRVRMNDELLRDFGTLQADPQD